MHTSAALFWVACGGAVGAFLRFRLSDWAAAWFGARFPCGTLLVNTLGCFLMGMLAGLLTLKLIPAEPWHDFIGEGLLGALTTFSTFSMDSFKLFRAGERFAGACNVVLSMILCLGAVSAGYAIVA